MKNEHDPGLTIGKASAAFIVTALLGLFILFVVMPMAEQEKKAASGYNMFQPINDDGEEADVLILMYVFLGIPTLVVTGAMLLFHAIALGWKKWRKVIKALALVALTILPVVGSAQIFWTDPNQYMRQQERWYDKHEDSCGICGQRLIWYTEASKPELTFDNMMGIGSWNSGFGAPEVPDSCRPKDLLRQFGINLSFRVCEYCRVKYDNHYADEIMKTKAGLIADYQHAEKKRRQQLAKALIVQRKKETDARIDVLEKKIENLKAGKPEDWTEPLKWSLMADSMTSRTLRFDTTSTTLRWRVWSDSGSTIKLDVPDNTVPVK